MAPRGYHKGIASRNPRLEIKRAGKDHLCAGVAIERGGRVGSGRMKDVWVWGRSVRCVNTIKHGQLHIENRLLPPPVSSFLGDWQGTPLCLYCGMDFYSEFFEGSKKAEYLKPMTPERRRKVIEGLEKILEEVPKLKGP